MTSRPEAVLRAIAAQFAKIDFEDAELRGIVITINLRAGGGNARGVVIRPEYEKALENGYSGLDSGGRVGGKPA